VLLLQDNAPTAAPVEVSNPVMVFDNTFDNTLYNTFFDKPAMVYEVDDIKKQLNVVQVRGSFHFRSCTLLYFRCLEL
jgi:hypothetical protein